MLLPLPSRCMRAAPTVFKKTLMKQNCRFPSPSLPLTSLTPLCRWFSQRQQTASFASTSAASNASTSSAATSSTAPSEKAKKAYPPSITVFASNVAVITGDNHYGSLVDVFDVTWKRCFPQSFEQSKQAAEVQGGAPILSQDQQIVEDVKALGLTADYEQALADATKPGGDTKVLNQTKRAWEGKLRDATKEDVVKGRKIIDYTRSQINKAFGTNNEPVFIKDFEFETKVKVQENNSRFFSKSCGVTNVTKIPWSLGGRIDGLVNGQLIEVKNRTKRLMDPIPGYENIQFQCYLHLLDMDQGVLHQRIKDDMSQYLKHTIRRDNALIQGVILPRLQIFCDFLDYFLSNPRFGVEYMLLQRYGQERFLQEYLQVKAGSGKATDTTDDSGDIIPR